MIKQTRAEREAGMRKMIAAQAHMKAHGWEHTMSIMDDSGTGGLVYVKGDREFVMNVKTWDNLPTD